MIMLCEGCWCPLDQRPVAQAVIDVRDKVIRWRYWHPACVPEGPQPTPPPTGQEVGR